MLGFVPHYGTIAVTCAAHLNQRSMFSAWMVGLEDLPERSGEICLMEVFGTTVRDGEASVGQGVHPFRDPALREDFLVTQVTGADLGTGSHVPGPVRPPIRAERVSPRPRCDCDWCW